MRDRLFVSFVAVILAVVAAFLLVRGYAVSERIQADQRHELEQSAEIMAGLLATTDDIDAQQLRSLLYDGQQVNYLDAAGRTIIASQHATAADHDMPERLSVTRAVPGGGRVTLSLRGDVLDDRVAAALLPLVVSCLALAGLAIAVAAWLSRRLARPFRELAEVAEVIGRGEFDVTVPRYRVPEADTLARVLRASAADLDVLTRREREFAAHASHALRTPITAARLELEDLAIAPETPPAVVGRLSDAVEQLDRLNTTVAGMLQTTRDRVGANGDVDLAALVRDAAERWRGPARGRCVVDDCEDVVAVRLPVGALLQLMDALLGNAVANGEGTIRVSVVEAAQYAEVRVADEGSRNRAAEAVKRAVSSGSGGLASATELAESLGGQLRLTNDATTTFSLVLPIPRRETVAS